MEPDRPIHDEGPVVAVWKTQGVLEKAEGVLLLRQGVLGLHTEGHEYLHGKPTLCCYGQTSQLQRLILSLLQICIHLQ